MQNIGISDWIVIALFGVGLVFAVMIGLGFLLLRRNPGDPP